MRRNAVLALLALALAACESVPIPTSETDAPPPNARVDMSCMQDCEGSQADPELCRSRCAK